MNTPKSIKELENQIAQERARKAPRETEILWAMLRISALREYHIQEPHGTLPFEPCNYLSTQDTLTYMMLDAMREELSEPDMDTLYKLQCYNWALGTIQQAVKKEIRKLEKQ